MQRKIILLVFSLSLLILPSISSIELRRSNGMFVLNKENFQEVLSTYQTLFVFFYNASSESSEFKEETYNAMNIINRIPENIRPKFFKMKIRAMEDLKTYQVPKSPYFIYYVEKKPHYLGQLTQAQILQVVQRIEGQIMPVKNQEEINLLTKETNPYTINLMYVGTEIDKEFTEFMEIKDSIKGVRFSICNSQICEKKYPKALQSFVLFKNYLPNKEVFYDRTFRENEFTRERILEWIDRSSYGYVMNFNERFIQIGFAKKGLALVIWRSDSSRHNKEYQKMLSNISKKSNFTEFSFYASDIDSDDDAKKAAQYFLMSENFDKSKLPYVALYDNRDGDVRIYPYHIDKFPINEGNLKKFLIAFKEGKVDRLTFSQSKEEAEKLQLDISKKHAVGDSRVQALVKDNFYDEVVNNKLDVFVMFYAHWCDHCHEIMPFYESLAQYLALNEHLKFKKVDLAKNSIDGLKITEFPTFKIFPAFKKDSPVEYNGSAVLEEVANFLKKYSNHTVEIPKIAKSMEEESVGDFIVRNNNDKEKDEMNEHKKLEEFADL